MRRPLLISDCDEVLLHMVVPFRDWLDEAHGIHFELTHGDWGEALRHKQDGTLVERGIVWTLLNGFFETEMHVGGDKAVGGGCRYCDPDQFDGSS
jgi:hypothetical protein